MAFMASELTQCVTFQKKAVSPDGGGGQNEAWQDFRREFALVRPMSGRERIAAERTEAIAGYLVVIRARTDLTEDMRILWRGRTLNIRFIKDRQPQEMFLEIECSRGVAT